MLGESRPGEPARSAVRLGRLLFAAALLFEQQAVAAEPEIAVDLAECLPTEGNATLFADVLPEVAEGSVRLYFRRLHPGRFGEESAKDAGPPPESPYWVEMNPSGDGRYWTTFPKPESREQRGLSDAWWQELKERDWMQDRDWMEGACRLTEEDEERRRCLEEWLAERENEAAEYFVGAYDADGELIASSPMYLVEVREDCGVRLTARESGWAANLTVGETVPEQAGKKLFHWLCEGVSSRVDWREVPRPDDFCRRCIIGSVPWARDTRAG